MRFRPGPTALVSIVAACGLVATACRGDRLAPLEDRVTTLEADVAALKAQLAAKATTTPGAPEAPQPIPIPLMGFMGDAFMAAGYALAEATTEELDAFRGTDGFVITKAGVGGQPAERLLVVGKAHGLQSDGKSIFNDTAMKSFSVVVDARVVDPATRIVVATSTSQAQVLGINLDVAIRQRHGTAKMDPMRTALLDKLKAARP